MQHLLGFGADFFSSDYRTLRQHFPDVKITYVPKDELTPDRGTLCVNKAREMIGYDPQFPLERGFVEYINWYKSIWESFNPAPASQLT